MAQKLNIYVSSDSKLSIKNSNLLLQKSDDIINIPIDIISSIVVDSYHSYFSQNLLSCLSRQGITLIICDETHMPTTLLLPLCTHSVGNLNLRAQLKCKNQTKAILWQNIVKAKLNNQANLLDIFGLNSVNLLRNLTNKVLLNDKDNKEAYGARIYFLSAFGDEFVRRDGGFINSMLNFGYALVRSKIARAIAAKGLMPQIGINHNSFLNNFNLADDMIEPYRPFIDAYVLWYLQNSGEIDSEFDSTHKKCLISIFDKSILIDSKRFLLDIAIEQSIDSLLRVFKNQENTKLLMPILDKEFLD